MEILLKKSLVLTGMMGVGKSTIGRILSKRLKFKFFDIDKIIEKNQKKKIYEIFEIKGESFFRDIEEKFTLKFIKKKNSVIALGGGAFINFKIRESILRNNKSFWLDAQIDALKTRIRTKKTRPLLSDNSPQNLQKIYNERKKIYKLANFKINCDNLDKYKIAKKIIDLYEKDKN